MYKPAIKNWLAGLICCLIVNAVNADSTDPFDAVEQANGVLLSQLNESLVLYETDPAAFYKAVDESLGPFIDFTGFSRGVMAKYYKRATKQQQQDFVAVFRKGLIETYSNALVGFDNQQINVVRPTTPQKKPERPVITIEITGQDGSIYKVDYNLILLDGQWKLRNVVINGINIGLQFRSQFQASMSKNKNNLDEVIAGWSVDSR
ncbi:MAG: ABC transporter substrate-binding protein [Pseudomonadales bacterium]|jgi:phospholipid transport system substrate-binding protein|nr:ABC transporter substrate-binding protein [Pseudomonadales bacterium]MDG1444353.1 ABC transporter substrate-binding protein [Pseudomonadales bacterium]